MTTDLQPGPNARKGRLSRARTYAPYVDYGVKCAPGTKPIYLYLRLSNYHNDASDAIERHRLDLTRMLTQQGCWTIMGEFVDNDSASKSAARTRRGWHLLGERIADGSVPALAFWKLDRCQRIAAKGIEWLGQCANLGVELVSYQEGLQNLTGTGKVLAGIQMLFAEHETDVMSTRQLAAKRHAAEAGYFHGGIVPFGWTVSTERLTDEKGRSGKRLAPHPVEHPALKRAVELALAGATLNEIAKAWADEFGITTASGRPQYATSILHSLRSPRLVGYRMRNVPSNVARSSTNLIQYIARDAEGEPVISQEPVCDRLTWERLQRVLDKNGKKVTTTRAPWGENVWLLHGLVYCPTCNRPLAGVSRGRVDGQRSYYDCVTNRRKAAVSCDRGVSLPVKALDNYVVGYVIRALTPERLSAAKAAKAATHTDDATVRALEEAKIELAELERSQGEYSGAMIGTLVRMMAVATQKVERLEAQLAATAPALDLPSLTGEELAAEWDAMTPHERRRNIKRAVERVDVLTFGRGTPMRERVRVTLRV